VAPETQDVLITTNSFGRLLLQLQRQHADVVTSRDPVAGPMKLILIRFLIGGVSVSTFALLGDLFKPKSFAGLFGAAPSVALATLALAVGLDGRENAAEQSTSMMASSIALFCYTSCVSWIMMHRPRRAILVTIFSLPVWGVVSFGLWWLLLK
jgi:Protein of unknown function (DUF3147)